MNQAFEIEVYGHRYTIRGEAEESYVRQLAQQLDERMRILATKMKNVTPMQLAASIQEKLKKYVTDPRVTVVVTAMNSQRIYVTGEVLHTGAMPLLPNMTVLQALANAGFSQFANTKGIYLLRFENGRQQKIPVNYRQLIKGEAMERNIIVKPGDTIVVP